MQIGWYGPETPGLKMGATPALYTHFYFYVYMHLVGIHHCQMHANDSISPMREI